MTGDIEHIVILMQENRSLDHYFGTMPGVRGFADPAAIRLPDGSLVFRQPYPGHAQGYLAPFHLDTKATSVHATPGTDHSWPTQHQAWNNGQMDQWVSAKGPFTMGTSPRPTSRSSGRWPGPSQSATATTARCSGRPTRTGCTCGPGRSTRRARAAARYPRSPQALTLAAAEAGLLTAQRVVFANPAPVIPARNEPVSGA